MFNKDVSRLFGFFQNKKKERKCDSSNKPEQKKKEEDRYNTRKFLNF